MRRAFADFGGTYLFAISKSVSTKITLPKSPYFKTLKETNNWSLKTDESSHISFMILYLRLMYLYIYSALCQVISASVHSNPNLCIIILPFIFKFVTYTFFVDILRLGL